MTSHLINGAQAFERDHIVSTEYHAIRGSCTVACFLTLTTGRAVVGLSHAAASPQASCDESLADAQSKIPEAMNQRSPHGDH